LLNWMTMKYRQSGCVCWVCTPQIFKTKNLTLAPKLWDTTIDAVTVLNNMPQWSLRRCHPWGVQRFQLGRAHRKGIGRSSFEGRSMATWGNFCFMLVSFKVPEPLHDMFYSCSTYTWLPQNFPQIMFWVYIYLRNTLIHDPTIKMFFYGGFRGVPSTAMNVSFGLFWSKIWFDQSLYAKSLL